MVIISNGFNKFHLAVAAAEAHRRGILSCLITGAYPVPGVRKMLSFSPLARIGKLARLRARREEVPDRLVRPVWMPETVYSIAMSLRESVPQAALWLNAFSFRYYGDVAVRYVREAARRGARLYHYRAGFGHRSVREARRLGLVTLCDHSIAHPAVLQFLVENGGRMPPRNGRVKLDRLWSDILEDIEQADTVLVNSEFVRDTFRHWDGGSRCPHIIYLGVDDAFLKMVPRRTEKRTTGPLRLLFAGQFERRKGAETLISALQQLDDLEWSVEIAGPVAAEVAGRDGFLADPRVRCSGWIPRQRLAEAMAAAEVFVFPSLAEGSARVVFEALSAGCYVITTPNAGSIVEDRVHGRIVPPGDADALASALREAANDRPALAAIGAANARLVRSNYRQSDYGDHLAALYRELAPGR